MAGSPVTVFTKPLKITGKTSPARQLSVEDLSGQTGHRISPLDADLVPPTPFGPFGVPLVPQALPGGRLTAGTLRAVPVSGLDLRRDLRAVWPTGRRLTGPAQDLYLIAARSGRPG